MPVGDVLIGNARCDIEHDYAALAVDVVSISQSTKFFLAGSVPDVEYDRAKVLVALVKGIGTRERKCSIPC